MIIIVFYFTSLQVWIMLLYIPTTAMNLSPGIRGIQVSNEELFTRHKGEAYWHFSCMFKLAWLLHSFV